MQRSKRHLLTAPFSMQRNYIDLRRKICCFNCVTVGIFPSLLWYLSIAVLCLSVVVTFSASLLNQFSFYSRKIPEWCFLILWVLILVYWLTTTVVIIIRRSMSPFRQRCVYLIILSGSANFAIFTYFLIRQAYPSIKIPCHVSHWWNNMSYSMLILPYIVRAWRLHVIFNFKRQSLLEENEVSKISKMISNKRLIILLLILLIPFIILSLSETFIPPLQIVLASEPGCGSPQTVRIFWISVNAGLFFFFSLMIFALRKVWDDFSIKQELMIIALSELFFLLFHSVSLAWPNQEENLNLHFLVCLRCVVYFWMSLSLPLYQSYGFEIIPVLTSPRDAQSFSGVLTNPEFFHFFMSFMSTDPDKPLIEVSCCFFFIFEPKFIVLLILIILCIVLHPG